MYYSRTRSVVTAYGLAAAGISGAAGVLVLIFWGALRNAKGVKLLPSDPDPGPLTWPAPMAELIDKLLPLGVGALVLAIGALAVVGMNERARRH